MRKIWAGLLLLACAPAFAAEEPVFLDERLFFTSSRAQNTLVELYTSDISPDCNGALKWMSSLQKEDPEAGLWKYFVPIVMHVSYWNVSGGKDVFTQDAFDDFLLRYKKTWHANRAYAPTMVVNGTEWGGWSHDQDIPKALPNEVGVLSADGRKWEGHFLVLFIPSKKIQADGLTVHAALLGFGVESKPQEGDNRGRLLTHDFLALAYAKQSFRQSSGVLSADFEITPKKVVRAKKYAVVFWVTPGDDVRPIQATGGYLPT